MSSKKSLSDEIRETILSQHFADGEKLPSVRKMAAKLGVAAGSISKVYSSLVASGIIKSYSGKGYFWGRSPLEIQSRKTSEIDSLEELFQKDMESGFLGAFSPLPSLKELASRYRTSLYMMRNFMNEKINKGILKKSGNKFSFCKDTRTTDSNFILFIHRCDCKGRLIIDTERETEVFRKFSDLAQEQNISIRYIGYCDNTNKLINTDGTEVQNIEKSKCLGAFLSTWLVSNPSLLFSLFSKCDFPISVWWEYSADILSKVKKDMNKWAYFNAAFGKNAGTIVGKHLKTKGIDQVNYISPFHDNEWSHKRLEGLEHEGIKVKALVDLEAFSPFDVVKTAQKKGLPPLEYLKSMVEGLLKNAIEAPFVCANDWVATALIEILDSEGKNRPYIIGFDNTAESYRYCFDSFAFNVETMVKEALYHIISPSNYSIFKKQVQNPPGKVVVKG